MFVGRNASGRSSLHSKQVEPSICPPRVRPAGRRVRGYVRTVGHNVLGLRIASGNHSSGPYLSLNSALFEFTTNPTRMRCVNNRHNFSTAEIHAGRRATTRLFADGCVGAGIAPRQLGGRDSPVPGALKAPHQPPSPEHTSSGKGAATGGNNCFGEGKPTVPA